MAANRIFEREYSLWLEQMYAGKNLPQPRRDVVETQMVSQHFVLISIITVYCAYLSNAFITLLSNMRIRLLPFSRIA
jgi:hypothetical protein